MLSQGYPDLQDVFGGGVSRDRLDLSVELGLADMEGRGKLVVVDLALDDMVVDDLQGLSTNAQSETDISCCAAGDCSSEPSVKTRLSIARCSSSFDTRTESSPGWKGFSMYASAPDSSPAINRIRENLSGYQISLKSMIY